MPSKLLTMQVPVWVFWLKMALLWPANAGLRVVCQPLPRYVRIQTTLGIFGFQGPSHQIYLISVPKQVSEKTYQLCPHASCNVAGLTADANILIDQARLRAGRYAYQYQEPIPVEQLVEYVCNYKQFYTQRGGLRPFGVAFLFAGYDEHYGFQLYQSDPSGNYSGWKATVIGANNQAGKSLLKSEYKTGEEAEESIPDVQEALKLAVKVLNKTMDGTTAAAAAEKMELYTMTLENGECAHHILNKQEAQQVIDAVEAEAASAGDAQVWDIGCNSCLESFVYQDENFCCTVDTLPFWKTHFRTERVRTLSV